MPGSRVLDHVAIGCASLEQGVAYIRDTLGVEVPPGGKHPRMGTHNRLMRLGDDLYFELIAIDPDAPPPGWPRWFALDEPWQQARLAERPRPIAWVARSADIAADLAAHPKLGDAVEMTRDDLVWRISLRADGTLPRLGLLPVLIEWPRGSPASRIPDLGVRLTRLRLVSGASVALAAELERLGKPHLVELSHSDGGERIELELRASSGALVTLR
jgi:catechol 2,3-dioxygenase-like lactoylglutathione lyase family enzyme